jgi:hypothetical protein
METPEEAWMMHDDLFQEDQTVCVACDRGFGCSL